MEGLIRACHESPQQQDKGLNFDLKAVSGTGGRVMGFVALTGGKQKAGSRTGQMQDRDVQTAMVWWAPWFVFSHMLS